MSLADHPGCNPQCRACHYKNLDYPEQLRRKNSWAMAQLGRWREVLREIRPALEVDCLAYRSKSWLRSDFRDGIFSFGMQRAVQIEGVWEKEFISWDTCPIHIEPIQKMIQVLKIALAAGGRDNLVGIWIGSPHLVIVARNPDQDWVKRLPWNKVLLQPFNQVWFHQNDQVGKKIFGHRPIVSIFDSSHSEGATASTPHPIQAFRQVARKLLTEARQEAAHALLAPGPELVVDLYCGTGELSLLLPQHVAWIGIEASREAVRYANTLRPELHSAWVGSIEQRLRDPSLLPKISGRYSLYVNPPRSGLSVEARNLLTALIQEKPPLSIVYLSCSASSLARDLPALEACGYQVSRLQPFDFFPQTEHFETLALLRRSAE